MDHSEACKGSCEREKCEIGKIAVANIATYGSEQEEGEIRAVDEPPRLESPIQKGTAASVEQDQVHRRQSASPQRASGKGVHIRQSASPQRASGKGESADTVVLQQRSMHGAIHKDISAGIVRSFVQDAIENEQVNIRPLISPERGSDQGRIPCIIFVQQSKCSAIQVDMTATPGTSSQGVVEDGPSTSAERGSHIGETASTAVVQESRYTASEGRHVDGRQSTLHRICGKHRRSYSPSAYSSSKERHKKMKEGCFRYSDSRWVLKMIEEVCSERLRTLILRQNGDRKNLKTVWKKHELEFFQKYVQSYKAHLAHVMPTISYCSMTLPKLHFSILRDRFHKHMKYQLIKFVKQQISDRNKENRLKARWMFEAKAGYLKKWFYVTSLTYGKFKLEKLECPMNDYLEGEEHLKYFNMQSLATQIESIASNEEYEGMFASGVTETILENSPSPLETNGPAKLGLSVGMAEEMTTLESRSLQSTCAPTMEFGEKNGTQTAFVERPYACQLDTSAALEPAKAVTTDKSSDVSEPIPKHSPSLLVTNGATHLGFSVDVSDEMATLESSSSQLTCAPGMEFGEKDGTQIAFSAASNNEGENMESPCASRLVTSSTSELAIAVSNDTENAAPVSREKRRRISSGNDMSESSLIMSGRKCGEKDGAQIALSPAAQNEGRDMERSCASHSDKDATLELAMTANTDSENTLASSSQLTCAPGMEFGGKDGTQIAFSAASENEGENMASPCASRLVTSSTSELAIAVSNDTENAAPISREKRRRISSGNDMSEGSCCMSGGKCGEKDGTQIALSPVAQNEGSNMERSFTSHSDKDAALELAMTANTDSENTLAGSSEKQTRISSSNNISKDPCSRSQIKFPDKPTSNLCRTTLHQEEPPAARPPPPSNSQMIQAEDTGVEEVPSGQISSFAQVTDQPNVHSNTQSVINQHHRGSTSQAASHPYEPPGGSTHSARTEVDSLGASHVPVSHTQLATGSTPGHFLAEDGLGSSPYTIELSRIQKLHELITKRHQDKREQLILARQIEMAQAKKKYDELVYNSEVEVLQRRRELKITCDKIYKQQILAEVLQVIFKASAKVVPDSLRGAAQRTTAEPNWSSDQRSFQFTAPVSTPASASIYQSPLLSIQASTDASLRQHRVTAQHTYMDASGRSTANLMNYPSGGMGLAHHRQA